MILLAIMFSFLAVYLIINWQPRKRKSIKKVGGKSSLERVTLKYEDLAFRSRYVRPVRSGADKKRNKARDKS